MDKLLKILSFLRDLPLWARVVASVALALVLLVATSCGQIVKVTVRDTPSGVSIVTSQNKVDSTSTNIKVDPTINLYAR